MAGQLNPPVPGFCYGAKARAWKFKTEGKRVVVGDVYPEGGAWMVGFRLAGTLEHFDEAGPFEGEDEAMDAARRGADDVFLPPPARAPQSFAKRGSDTAGAPTRLPSFVTWGAE